MNVQSSSNLWFLVLLNQDIEKTKTRKVDFKSHFFNFFDLSI